MVKINREFIMSGRTIAGGWRASQLKLLGVDWPPRRGWIDVLVKAGREIDSETARLFLACATTAAISNQRAADGTPC